MGGHPPKGSGGPRPAAAATHRGASGSASLSFIHGSVWGGASAVWSWSTGPVLISVLLVVSSCHSSSSPGARPEVVEPHEGRSEPVESVASSPGTRGGESSEWFEQDNPWTPVEVVLPRPAIWVSARLGDPCGVAWYDGGHAVAWSNRMPLENEPPFVEPDSLRVEQEFRYRHLPWADSLRCDVLPSGELRCRTHRCLSTAVRVGTQPPTECLGDFLLSPAISTVQRTQELTLERPWWSWRTPNETYFVGEVPAERREGDLHTCTQANGRVRCFPVRTGVARPSRVQAPGLDALSAVSDLDGAGNTVCAVTADGQVYCWGQDLSAEPEESERGAALEAYRARSVDPWTPRRIETLPSSIVQVSVANDHACARTRTGRIFCWGAVGCAPLPNGPERGEASSVSCRGCSARASRASGSRPGI